MCKQISLFAGSSFHFYLCMLMSTETTPSWFSLLIMFKNNSHQMKDQAYTLLSQHSKLSTLPGIWGQQYLPGPNLRSCWMLGCSRSPSTMRKQLSQMHTFFQWIPSFFLFCQNSLPGLLGFVGVWTSASAHALCLSTNSVQVFQGRLNLRSWKNSYSSLHSRSRWWS